MENNMWKVLGSWLLLIGIIISIIVGLIFGANTALKTDENVTTPVMGLLAVLGFLVGVLSFFAVGTITKEKVPMFLIGTLILIGLAASSPIWASAWGNILSEYLTNIVTYLAIFASPAAVLLAIRALWDAGVHKEALFKTK
jgi:hypothetical protein